MEAPAPEAAPSDSPTLTAVLEADGRFSTLLAAVAAAGLTETLAEPGPFTVFAPTDEAFAALPEGTLEALTPEDLQGVLLGHVVLGAVSSEDAAAAGVAPTAWGDDELAFTAADGALMVEDATIVDADLEASNGMIHVIDSVLLPAADAAPAGEM